MTLAHCLFVSALAALCTSAAAISVRDCGAVGDGKTDDSDAFRRALAAPDGEVLVPAGTYRLGDVAMPDGTVLRGVGARSVLVLIAGVEAILQPGNDCTVRDLKLLGDETDTASPIQKGLVRIGNVAGVSIRDLIVENTSRAGVITDQATRFRVTDCRFSKIGIAVHVVFSDHGVVSGNLVEDAKEHGIQFWGNWEFGSKLATDLTFVGNQVRNAGGGGIWGAGGVRIVMSGNVIDGAGDVGLDDEWCDDSTIVGNTVRNATNAGVSLFYACHNITICGNTVVITEGAEGRRDGIWLTETNKVTFPGDNGHRLVSITGNTVRAEGTPRHGIDVGAESEQILSAANLLENADILDASGHLKTE